jgi:DNA-binding response OmpR family regulator
MPGSLRAEDEVAAFELGALAYLHQPVDVEQLIGLAREILRSRCAERTTDAAIGNASTPSGAP